MLKRLVFSALVSIAMSASIASAAEATAKNTEISILAKADQLAAEPTILADKLHPPSVHAATSAEGADLKLLKAVLTDRTGADAIPFSVAGHSHAAGHIESVAPLTESSAKSFMVAVAKWIKSSDTEDPYGIGAVPLPVPDHYRH